MFRCPSGRVGAGRGMAYGGAVNLASLCFAVAFVGGAAYVGVMTTGAQGPARLVKVVPALALAVPLGLLHPLLGLGYVAWAGGDFFLLDKEKGFVRGLASFLLGHLLVAAGALLRLPAVAERAWLPVVLVGAGLGMVALLWRGLRGPLEVAVPLYTAALVAMAVVVGQRDLLALSGGLVFVVSDAVLGWQKFRGRLRGGDHVVILTYYLGIGLVAAGLLAAVPPA